MYTSSRKKQRGASRRLSVLRRRISEIVPFAYPMAAYEHYHVPSGMFIEHPKTAGKIKTRFCRAWLKKTKQMIAQKPQNVPFCKIVCSLSVPTFWASQIIVFYDEKYYQSFWDRDTDAQKWQRLASEISLADIRNLQIDLKEIGFHEIINADGVIYENDLWFYGDVPFFFQKEKVAMKDKS